MQTPIDFFKSKSGLAHTIAGLLTGAVSLYLTNPQFAGFVNAELATYPKAAAAVAMVMNIFTLYKNTQKASQ